MRDLAPSHALSTKALAASKDAAPRMAAVLTSRHDCTCRHALHYPVMILPLPRLLEKVSAVHRRQSQSLSVVAAARPYRPDCIGGKARQRRRTCRRARPAKADTGGSRKPSRMGLRTS